MDHSVKVKENIQASDVTMKQKVYKCRIIKISK